MSYLPILRMCFSALGSMIGSSSSSFFLLYLLIFFHFPVFLVITFSLLYTVCELLAGCILMQDALEKNYVDIMGLFECLFESFYITLFLPFYYIRRMVTKKTLH